MIRIQEEPATDSGFLRAHTDASVYVTQLLESGYGISLMHRATAMGRFC